MINPITAVEMPMGVQESRKKWLGKALTALEPLSVAGLFVYLLAKSWLRWGDPLIDFPRDLYIAWRLSEGDLLYQKIANWYGPLANLVEGAGFRVFGVGLHTIIGMNLALAVAALLLLRGIFGAIGNRFSVWLVSVVFLSVFAFGNLSDIANYNFFTPYVAQSTYSFLGLLLVLWGLLRHLNSDRPLWLGVSGLGLAVAYLDKPEAVLAAVGAIGIYFLARSIRASHSGEAPARWFGRAALWLAGGFLSLWTPVFIYFWVRGGTALALDATNRVLTTLLDGSIRHTALSQPLMHFYMGVDHPLENFLVELKVGGSLLLVCGTMGLAAWVCGSRPLFSPLWRFALFGINGAAILGGWLGMLAGEWQETGSAFVLPVLGVTLLASFWALLGAVRAKESFSRRLGLAVVGVAASLMLARIILFAEFSHYGFFMMPLAVCFWIHVMMVEVPRLTARPGEARDGWILPVIFSLLVLFGVGTLLRIELQVYSVKTYAVGTDRDRYYTYQPLTTEHGALIHPTGVILDTMVRAFKLKTPNARTLLALPEGIAVNYYLRVRDPLAEIELNPAVLGYVGTGHILQELSDNPPEVVCLFARDYPDYGMKYFGSETASGRDIVLWLNEHYDITVKAAFTSTSVTGHVVDLAVPKAANDGRLPIISVGL